MNGVTNELREIDHHPGFCTSPETPSYFVVVEDFATGDEIESHIHLTEDELIDLVRSALKNPWVLTIGSD